MSLSENIKSIVEPLTQKGYEMFDGNCLDFAAGVALSLQDNGYDAWVASIERLDLDDYTDEEINEMSFDEVEVLLSHAVVGVLDEGKITYYDATGASADMSWEMDFNTIRRENGEDEVDFDIVDHKEAVMHVYEDLNAQFNMNRKNPELIEMARGLLNESLNKELEPEVFDSPGP